MFRKNAYYPYRAFKDRPYFKEFGELPDAERRWDTLSQMAMFSTLAEFGPPGTRSEDLASSPCGIHEAHLSTMVAEFFMRGQVVFHIAPALRSAFLSSDLGDATGADLKFPFDTFYVHLGADLGLTFNDGEARLEGAFLQSRDGKGISVALVGALTKEPPHVGYRGLESFHFFVNEDEMDVPLLDAIKKRLAEFARDPNEVKELNDWDGFSDEQKTNIQDHWAQHSREREFAMKNLTVTLTAMKLVANALLYLSQYPEDVETAWQEGTPRGYAEKFARQASDKKAQGKTLSRAQNEGFTIIRKVGKLFEQVEAKGTGDSPTPHLRRAHWRRQAYGPGLSQRKLMWIRAVRVLGGDQRERPYLMAASEVSSS